MPDDLTSKPAQALYIHIPFCLKKCLYCDFYSIVTDERQIDRYVNAICIELTMRHSQATTIETIYIGGGTPSLLNKTHISRLIDCIETNYNLSPHCETTIEVNPLTLNYEKASWLLDKGFNRISIGIQSLKDSELTTLGRIHTAKDGIDAIRIAKEAGFDNLSVDLLYGIPNQKLNDWLQTLNQIVELNPKHLSIYELTPHSGTVFYDKIQRGLMSLPPEDLIEQMYLNAIEILKTAGYEHYEISNFALANYRCRHNINYWSRGTYLGIGASAHSFDGRMRFSNTSHLKRYMEALESNQTPIEELFILTKEDALKESVFLGLRLSDGIDRGLLSSRQQTLMELTKERLIELVGDRFRLTGRGMLLSNEIILRLW